MGFIIKNNVLERYTGNDAHVVIPDGVRKIDILAFAKRDGIVELTVPASVGKIGWYTFAQSASLERVHLLGRTVLGKGAFYQCARLEVLDAPLGLGEIEPSALSGCARLRSPLLAGRSFELITLNDARAAEEIVTLRDTDIERCAYSWEDYQRITAALLDYDLLLHSEEEDELAGDTLYEDMFEPIEDGAIVVKDGAFFGCALEREHVFYGHNELERLHSLDLLKPNGKSINVETVNGGHCAFTLYRSTKATLQRRDPSDPQAFARHRVHTGRCHRA